MNTISATEMRQRLLDGLRRPPPVSEDWVTVLSSSKNRDLLALIGRAEPSSIGELADLAGRAQPNVSRSLSSLHSVGLISVTTEGRRSVPALTEFGREKALELGLMHPDAREEEQRSDDWLRVHFDPDEGTEAQLFEKTDAISGSLVLDLWLKEASEATTAKWSGDLVRWGEECLRNWWRLLYRRDAPLRLLDVEFAGRSQRATMSISSGGHRIYLLTRALDGPAIETDRRFSAVAVDRFEDDLIRMWLRPIAVEQRRRTFLDTALQSALTRVLSSREDPAEAAFCRTAGALALSPYALTDDLADLVRRLMDDIQEEDARLDFASAILSEELVDSLNWVETETRAHGEQNTLPSLVELRKSIGRWNDDDVRPWKRGRQLARSVRAKLNLPIDRSVDGVAGLTRLLGAEHFELSSDAPGAVRAYQRMRGDNPLIVAEDEGPKPSTFTLARAVGDFLAFASQSSCVADIYTDRQAVGRAFAAELIAPAAGVVEMVEAGEPSYKIERHYGASQQLIRRQYENAGRD